MRRIHSKQIRKAVRDLCIRANTTIRHDILRALTRSRRTESDARARSVIGLLLENAKIARERRLAICQDTGMVIVFAKIGQEVSIEGQGLSEALNAGVADGYRQGCLRKSVVGDPLERKNTTTNTPCLIHTEIVKGRSIRIGVMPKGFGSENKSAVAMLNPSDGADEIARFVLGVVKKAGPDACPPFVVGVGIGGTFDGVALLAKKALMRSIAVGNRKKHIAKLEKDLLRRINALGIGPLGLGGKTTALGVNIEVGPTHIAGLPVAVNMSCHATRGAEKVL